MYLRWRLLSSDRDCSTWLVVPNTGFLLTKIPVYQDEIVVVETKRTVVLVADTHTHSGRGFKYRSGHKALCDNVCCVLIIKASWRARWVYNWKCVGPWIRRRRVYLRTAELKGVTTIAVMRVLNISVVLPAFYTTSVTPSACNVVDCLSVYV